MSLRSRAAVALTVAVALLLPPSASVSAARPAGPAQTALQAARDLFGPGPGATNGREATLILRDLALVKHELTGAERAAAEELLARPFSTGGVATSFTCTGNMCFHWETSGQGAPDLTDADANGVPDQVDTTADTFEQVWSVEVVQYGYRAPKPDTIGPQSPDERLDIYISDVGADGVFGYCTTDDPNIGDPGYPYSDYSAFCVVDNDFAPDQFPDAATPLAALQATAAHEFFHAVQFAYDSAEDGWLIEGTATWIEDEVFDDINDNYNFLRESQLTGPQVPIDFAGGGSNYQYGAWLFWRFLVEYLTPPEAPDPSIIRDIWERADGSAVGINEYSLQAVKNVIKSRGSSIKHTYSDFAAFNYVADTFYEEGVGYVGAVGYPPEKGLKVTRSKPVRSTEATLDHLSVNYVAFRPRRGVKNRARLKLVFDLPRKSKGGAATVVVLLADGTNLRLPVPLDRAGDGKVKVPFSPADVIQVAVALTNASARMDSCGFGYNYSCGGLGRDDATRYRVKGVLLQ